MGACAVNETITKRLATLLPRRAGSLVFSHGAGAGIVGGLRESYCGSSRALYEWAVARSMDATWLHASQDLPFAAGATANFKTARGMMRAATAAVSVGGSNCGAPWPLLSDRTWVVQCWHGTPLKCIGAAWPGSDPRDLMIVGRGDFFISSGREYTKRFQRCYPIEDERFWETGNPRNDRLVNAPAAERDALRGHLARAIGFEPSRVALFAPTWREWRSEPRFFPVSDLNLDALRRFLDANDAVLILRSHHREAKAALAQGWHGGRIQVSDALDLPWEVNDWQIASDVLVTDYSSIFFDFLVLDRPIIHTPYDLDEYALMRGFMVDPMEDFAGPTAVSQRELVAALDEAFSDPSAHALRRRELNQIHNPYEDGNSTERVASRLLALTLTPRPAHPRYSECAPAHAVRS